MTEISIIDLLRNLLLFKTVINDKNLVMAFKRFVRMAYIPSNRYTLKLLNNKINSSEYIVQKKIRLNIS